MKQVSIFNWRSDSKKVINTNKPLGGPRLYVGKYQTQIKAPAKVSGEGR